MVEGKPYRYGLIVAGLGVVAVGLFIMTQEQPHVYITMCVLGVSMVCVGTAWSLCQCYPQVSVTAEIRRDSLDGLVRPAAAEGDERGAEAPPAPCGQKSSAFLPEVEKSRSCPTLQLV